MAIKFLRILFFPWLIFSLIGWPARAARRRFGTRSRLIWPVTVAAEAIGYLLVALPLTIVLVVEILISANEWAVGEQADYRLQSDFAAGLADATLVVPGPRTPISVVMPSGASSHELRRRLVERYAPVILQKVSDHPEWDVPLFLDFDQNEDPRDNVESEPSRRPHVAGVYGELTAETEDSYYLTYSLYHVKDYDHPIRQLVSRWTYHDNDNEGFHIRVDKRTMEVAEAEVWFHNRFLLCNHDGRSHGTEPVHGKIQTEDGTHIVIYAQSQGHGVRCAQAVDRDNLRKNVKVLRYRGDRRTVPVRADADNQYDATYELRDFREWYRRALPPYGAQGEPSLFEESIVLGAWPSGAPIEIGRFIAGKDYAVGSWSRPKPMWSWDDGWDDVPIFVWHFFPSRSFESHGGTPLSHRYLYNAPVAEVFGMSAEQLWPHLDLEVEYREGSKWDSLEGRGGRLDRSVYWAAGILMLKKYVNYVFTALG